jgi:hypothetical protein
MLIKRLMANGYVFLILSIETKEICHTGDSPHDNKVGRNFSHVQRKDDEGLPSEEGSGSEEEGFLSRSPRCRWSFPVKCEV